MDARAELRVEIDEPVMVTQLGEEKHPPFPGWIQNHSRCGIGLKVGQPLALESPIKIEWGRTMVLGEVCYCLARGSDYLVGVVMAHTILDTEELARLANRLLDEESSADRRERTPASV